MGAYLPNRHRRGEKTLSSFDELCRTARIAVSRLAPRARFAHLYVISLKASRGTVEAVRGCHLCSPRCVSLFLPAANPVPEVFSHNTKRSHPELSALDSLSSRANKSSGNAFRVRGEKPPESPETSPDTYSSPLRVTQQKEPKNATQYPNRTVSIGDRSLENVLHLVTQTRSEAVGLKFVWVCVQIGQLSCKACVCVSGTPSMR